MGLFDANPWVNPDTGQLGVSPTAAQATPQLPSPEQYAADMRRYNAVSGFKQGLLKGIIGMIAGPDPSALTAGYNGLLGGAQGAEQGRLTTGYYDQANGAGQPQTAPSAAMPMPAAPQGAAPSMGADQPAPSTMYPPAPGGIFSGGGAPAAAPAVPGMRGPMPAAGGGWGPAQILGGLRVASMVPGLAKNMPAYISALDTAIKEGKSIGPDGSIYNTPGALSATTLDALAKAHISPGGVNPMDPRSVNGAVAGQAGSEASAKEWAGVGPANAKSDHSTMNKIVEDRAKPNDLRENATLVRPPMPTLGRGGWNFGSAGGVVPGAPATATPAVAANATSPQSKGDSNVSAETLPDGTQVLTNSGTVRTTTENNEKLYKEFEGFAAGNKGAEQNIKNAAEAFRHFEGGAGTEMSAEAAAWMKRFGINPDLINAADPAQVQIAKKAVVQAIFSQMSGIQNPALGEFQLAEKAAGQPDFQPDAVKAIFGNTLGKMAMQDEFFQNMAQHRSAEGHGTMRGYDPSKFLLNADMAGYQKKAEQSLPWFKGETGAPVYTKLKTPPTDADIAATALKYNMTTAAVRAKLGMEAK
jgi:hypothetical protein